MAVGFLDWWKTWRKCGRVEENDRITISDRLSVAVYPVYLAVFLVVMIAMTESCKV